MTASANCHSNTRGCSCLSLRQEQYYYMEVQELSAVKQAVIHAYAGASEVHEH